MVILRNKQFSIWSSTVDWAKKFTPRIPIGENAKLYFLWPGTILGAMVGFIKGIKEKHSITGSTSNDHGKGDHGPLEKKFSDVPMDADFNEYCKEIKEYAKLAALSSYNFRILKSVPEEGQKFIWKCFPSFMVLAKPEEIRSYREDYMSDPSAKGAGDYAEVLFTFGNELVYLWDFDRKAWYVQDRTYNPRKEWRIKDNDLFGAIEINFDPKYNKLLANRLDAWDNKYGDTGFDMRKYCECLLSAIKLVKNSRVV